MIASVHGVRERRQGTSPVLERIIASIPAADDFDELRPVLAALSRETERIIGENPMSFEEASRIADLLTNIRVLLAQTQPGREQPDTEHLAARYAKLEGATKEIRNDLGRIANRARR